MHVKLSSRLDGPCITLLFNPPYAEPNIVPISPAPNGDSKSKNGLFVPKKFSNISSALPLYLYPPINFPYGVNNPSFSIS